MPSLITSEGLNWNLNRTFGTTTEAVPDEWEIGVDSTAPTEADTPCLGRVPHTYSVFEDCDAITGWAQGGDGGAPVLNTTGMNEGTGCLNIPISFSSGTSTWSKTITSINLTTNNRDLYMFFYVDDKTNITAGASGIKVIIGTGGFVNYNEYYFDKADITASEWNVLIISDPSSPDATGGSGATLSNIDRIRLEVNTTGSYVSDSLRMDAWFYANESDHQKSVEAGYPVVSTILHQVVWKVKYDTNQANGFKLVRVFFKNSNDMSYNSGTYTAVNKDSSKEFTITTLQKVRNPP